MVEDGNPADNARCLPMLARHVEHYGAAPTHAAFDGGYASRANLEAAKALCVTHAVFHKKRGMKVADMTPSACVVSGTDARPCLIFVKRRLAQRNALLERRQLPRMRVKVD